MKGRYYMFISMGNQRGSSMAIALVAMMLLAVGGTSYSLATNSNLANTQNYGQGAAAQKAAEAGVNFALAHAKARTVTVPAVTTDDYMNQLNGKNNQSISDVAGEENMGTFNITSTRNTLVTAGNDYKITSIGTVGNVTRTVVAFISMTDASTKTAPSVFDLINTGSVSTKNGVPQKWTVGTGLNAIASAPSKKDFNQILFADHLYANDNDHLDGNKNPGFTLNYNIKLNNITGSASANGYGIYYLASGTGDNMSGYVLQYDPGLTPDQILVRKVIQGKTNYSEVRPYQNDKQNYTYINYDYTQRYNYDTWQAFQRGNQQIDKYSGWDNQGKLTIASSLDNTAIPLDTVMRKLNDFKPRADKKPHDMKSEHTITIDVRPDANGKVNHTISIDGLQVLKFIDRGLTETGPVFTEGSTGLRVWGADVDFKNTTNGNDVPIDAVPATIRAWGEKNKYLKTTP